MNAERLRTYLLSLPYVVEKAQFGGIIFCVGDLATGGKMFAMINPDAEAGMPASFCAGVERMPELLELEGVTPAKYLARAFWVSAERWEVFRDREWEAEVAAAHVLTLRKLAPRTLRTLGMPAAELEATMAERAGRLRARRQGKAGT